jgi:hypothetical protein
VVAPSLVATEADLDYFVDSLDATLDVGLARLVASFVREKMASRRPARPNPAARPQRSEAAVR